MVLGRACKVQNKRGGPQRPPFFVADENSGISHRGIVETDRSAVPRLISPSPEPRLARHASVTVDHTWGEAFRGQFLSRRWSPVLPDCADSQRPGLFQITRKAAPRARATKSISCKRGSTLSPRHAGHRHSDGVRTSIRHRVRLLDIWKAESGTQGLHVRHRLVRRHESPQYQCRN